MRVQFTKDEEKIIDERRQINANSEGIIVPVEMQGQIMTLGVEITDVHKFNMFMDNLLKDPKIAEQIGVRCIHADFRPPIAVDNIIFLRNYIDGILFGPQHQEVAPQEPQEEIKMEEIKEEDSTSN